MRNGKVCVHWKDVGDKMAQLGYTRSPAALAAHFKRDFGTPPAPLATHPHSHYLHEEDACLLDLMEANIAMTSTGKARVNWEAVLEGFKKKGFNRTLLGLKEHASKITKDTGGIQGIANPAACK